ncbi:MAG: GntR family transcriptional regulator [Alphaproteobacteria bacterium]|nr:GntR family transcriptional regulator [Alphaproteobacteria bacterium]
MTSTLNDTDRPRYQIIADDLMADIVAEKFSVGSMLPTEMELCERYNVSRYTVREALRQLREMGMVSMRRGSGTRVMSTRPEQAYVQSVSALSELLRYPGTSFELMEAGHIVLDDKQAESLHSHAGDDWFHISGVRRSDVANTPICWQDVYVLPQFEDAARQVAIDHRAVHQIIEQRHGEIIGRAQLDMFASHIDETLAEYLEVAPDTAAMTIIRHYTDHNGRLFESTRSIHPEGRFVYSLELQRDWRTRD